MKMKRCTSNRVNEVHCSSPYYFWTASLVVSLLLLFTPPSCNAENPLQIVEDICPIGSAVQLVNRTIWFTDLPSRDNDIDPSYDAGAIGNWFLVAREFVNVVKEENLPYDVIEEGIESGGVACDVGTKPKDQCLNDTSSSFDTVGTFSSFLQWWTPILIVSGVGVAVGLVFLLVGCVFCICRCCGQCGGSYSQRQSHDCAMCSCTLLLLLCTLGLLSGMVLTFYSNQQVFDSLDSVRVSVNSATDHAVEFAEDLLNDGIAVFCHVADIVVLSFEELEGLGSALDAVLRNITRNVETFLTTLDQTADAIEGSSERISRVVTVSNELRREQRRIKVALVGVANDADSLLEDCQSSGTDCRVLPNPSIFITVANYSMLPNEVDVSANVNMTLSDVDFEKEASMGRSNFSECVSAIEQNITLHINETGMELERLNETVIEQRDNITNSTREVLRRDQSASDCSDFSSILRGGEEEGQNVDLNAGFIQRCIVDQGFEQLKQYDAYRYGFGVVVCCLSLIVAVLVLLGLLLGVIGWRPKQHPSDRTRVSNCGGVFLLLAVGVAYLFGCVVMVLSAFGFFFGANAQKVCQSLEGPEYEGFANIVDNQEVWGGSLLGTVLFKDPQEILSFSQLLRNCEDNDAIYKAMNLTNLFDIHNDIINFTEVTATVSREIIAAVESIQLGSDSFFSSTALQALTDFAEQISRIDSPAYLDQVEASTLGFNVDKVIQNLTEFRDATTDTTLQAQADSLISDINAVASMADEIDSLVDMLEMDINDLNTLVTSSSELVLQATDIISYITGDGLAHILNQTGDDAFNTIAQYIDAFVQNLADELDSTIGRCRPLWGVYTELHLGVCYEVVDGLNGFWLSLGLCALFFIPVIALSVATSTCFFRHDNTPSSYFMDDPYSDYLMDDSKRNSSMSMKDNNYYAAAEDKV